MHYSFLIIDNGNNIAPQLLQLFDNFPNYFCAGIAKNNDMAIEMIIKLKPRLVIAGAPKDNSLCFTSIQELYQYLDSIPCFIFVADTPDYALEAIQAGFSDYLLNPLTLPKLGKTLFRFEKRYPFNTATTICIKSYSDYHFVPLEEILYFKADNNTTDLYLTNNKKVAAYKTLKHFEKTLPFYFLRIHKSYIVNIRHVSRIHLSKSKCYLNYNEILPFSLTYKENIDAIIRRLNVG